MIGYFSFIAIVQYLEVMNLTDFKSIIIVICIQIIIV